MDSFVFKIVTLGEGRVGKTSLTLKFVRDQFNQFEKSTINANFLDKTITVGGVPVTLNIWDTAGQERFKALTPNYYKQAKGAILVYDITDKTTFDRVRTWVNQLRSQADPDLNIVIAGNKCDREQERNISKQEAMQYASSIRASHFSTSAKTGKGVQELFMEIARLVYESQEKQRVEQVNQQKKRPTTRARAVTLQKQESGTQTNKRRNCGC